MRPLTLILGAALAALFFGCGGDAPAPKLAQPTAADAAPTVRGVNLFYLANGSQDIPYILRTIDEPATRADLDRILTGLQAANVNSIRLLIAADHFPLNKLPNAWPQPDRWQTEGLRKLVDLIAARGLSVYLVFVGKTVNEQNALFISAEGDLQWIGAFLSAVDHKHLIRVDLSGDVFVCDDSGCEISEYQRNHGAYVRALWQGRPRLSVPVGYEVAGPHENGTPRQVRHVIRWVLEQTPGAPLSLAFYPLADRVSEYASVIAEFNVPVLISEYGGDLAFYRAFLAEKCKRGWPAYAWTAGVGWGGLGLWNPTLNDPTPQLAELATQYGRCT